MYEPREDSLLLMEAMKRFAHGKCLDMGTGSGILAEEALRHCDTVVAADIYVKPSKHLDPQIRFVYSDLFSNISERFDTIIFNPPYLPGKSGDRAVDGGRGGIEVIKRFLKQAKKHLNPRSQILLVTSSLTDRRLFHKILSEQVYQFDIVARKKIFFEELYVYRITMDR